MGSPASAQLPVLALSLQGTAVLNTWHSHGPTATFLILTAFLEVQGRQLLFITMLFCLTGTRNLRREQSSPQSPWRTPICLPGVGIQKATEEKPLDPSDSLYFGVRYHPSQLLLIFSLPQLHPEIKSSIFTLFFCYLAVTCTAYSNHT